MIKPNINFLQSCLHKQIHLLCDTSSVRHLLILTLYGIFFSLFVSIVESFIPGIIVTIRPRDKPWMTKEILRATRKRDRLFIPEFNQMVLGKDTEVKGIRWLV